MAILYFHAFLFGVIAFAANAQKNESEVGLLACKTAINEMIVSDPAKFAKLSMASGKSLPYDAGKYAMCTNMQDTRYFLLKMDMKPSIPIGVGLCVPSACDHHGMKELMGSGLLAMYIPEFGVPDLFANISTTSPQLDLKYNSTEGMLAAGVVGILALLALCSTACVASAEARTQSLLQDQLPLDLPPQAPKQPLYIQAFSLIGKSGTLTKLMEIPAYKPTDCLNGLRVLSMCWIILGHTFIMPLGISGFANQEDIVKTSLNANVAEKNPWAQIIVGAEMGVDTFFFLSGFLLSLLTLKELRSKGLNICSAIVLRYARLTPSLALVMLVYYKLWTAFGYGPFSVIFQDSISKRCDASWWSELTYTMNFTPFDSNKVCMGWTWYLGDDMIFFIVSLFILPLYHKQRWLGWLTILTITGVSFGVTTWLVLHYNLGIYIFDSHFTRYSYWAYSKPYTRIPAYFVGIMAAWILDELERRGTIRETCPRSRSAYLYAKVGAGCAGIVLLALVFVQWTDMGDYKNSWGHLATVMYIDFSRPLWAMGWAVITCLCYFDYLPALDSFLAHPSWTPLARLSYGAYLVHPLAIKLAAGRSLQFYTFNSWDMIYRSIGNCLLAYGGALLLWVLVERPFMTLFSPARKPKPQGEQSDAITCKTDSLGSKKADSLGSKRKNDSDGSAMSLPMSIPQSGWSNVSTQRSLSEADLFAITPIMSCSSAASRASRGSKYVSHEEFLARQAAEKIQFLAGRQPEQYLS